MGDNYAECHKTHQDLGGKSDGCQEFMLLWGDFKCGVCGCHRNFHRKVEPPKPPVKYKTEVFYTKCHKIHDFGSQVSVDGCQEFTPKGENGTAEALTCALCGCQRGFHRNEFTTEVTSTSQGFLNED